MGRIGCTAAVRIMLMLTVSTAPVHARDATVMRKGSQTPLTGPVVAEDERGITLEVFGAEIFVPAAQVESVSYQTSLEDRYRARRAAIDNTDLDARYDLAKWLRKESGFDLALAEVDDLVQRDPDDARFSQLRRSILVDKAAMDRKPVRRKKSDRTATSGEGVVTPDPSSAEGRRKDLRLTEEQVNVIKIWETDPRKIGSRTRAVVPRAVMQKVIGKYGDDPLMPVGAKQRRGLLGLDGGEKLKLMVALDAREFFPQVIMRDEPPAMLTFRRQFHRQYVIGYCGKCHGTDESKGLRLLREHAVTERAAYTNFAILERFENREGFRMIDRDEPRTSLLLAYGLPRGEAKTPHPEVSGLGRYFRTRLDKRYAAMLAWINELRRPLHARHYGLAYTPPKPAGPNPARPTGGRTSDRDEAPPPSP